MKRSKSSWLSTIAKLGFKRSRRRSTVLRRSALGTYSRRLTAEPLEERLVLAITVSTLVDDVFNSGNLAAETADGGGLSLREAIAVASAGETINFDASLTSNGPARILLDKRDSVFTESALVIGNSLTITGPGANLLTIDASGNDPTPDSMPFDSSTGVASNDGDGSRVFRMNGTSSVVTLSGLTLTGGDLKGNKGGGAIRSQVNLTLDGVYIVDNAAYSINATDPQGQGGGIYQAGGTLLVKNSTIARNSALMSIDDVSTVNARGGGIFAANAAVTIVNSTISQNQTTFEGGGIYFVGSGTAKLTNVTVYGNRTTADPAEIRYHDTTAPYAPPYQMKSGFSNAGGGIAVGSGTVELHNTLVAGNVKNIDTSDLILKTTDTTPHTMARTADDVSGVFSSASSHNLIGYDESTANNINNGTSNNLVGGESVDSLGVRYGINAKVGLLANNGGTVPTHALVVGSPAINVGSDTWASDPNGDSSTTDQLTTDQRGFSRKMGSGGVGTVDIGAYETGIIVTSLEDDGAGSLLTLREALSNSQALSKGEIVFDPSLFAVTTDSLAGPDAILLDQGQLVANSDVTITGPGKDVLLIDAHQASRVIEISSGKSVAIRGLTLMGGKVTGSNRGGGIYVSGNLTLDSAVVRDNEAIDQGGGIYVANPGTVHIVDSTISDNVSAQGGAIKSKSSAENAVVIEGSAVINNSATTFGGIFISGDAGAGTKTAKIVNSTFSGNTVTSTDGNGGAIAVNSGFSLTVINSTITDNHAGTGTGSGGGIWNGATVTLYNTILAGNVAGNSTTSDAYASMSAASSYNLIGQNVNVDGSGDGTGTIKLGSGQTAGLAPLADNGGPTLTHRLEKGSQAINAGSDTHVTSSMTTDQRGFTRKVNQTANQLETDDPDHEDEGTVANDQVDMGAYELGLVVTTWYDEGYLYNSDFGPTLSLREALHAAEHMLPQDDDITFDVDVFATHRTITLGVSEYGNVWEHEESAEDQAEDLRELTDLGIDSNVRIVGPGAMKLTIDAASKEKIDAYAELVEDDLGTEDIDESHIEGIRVFYIGDHDSRNHLDHLIRTKDEDPTNPNFEWVTASISGLTITGGRLESATPGGGVYNGGALTIDEVILRDNYTFLWGGGLFATGDTIIRSSIVDSNRAAGDTGAYSGGVSARGFVEVVQNTTADGEQLNLIRPGALTIVDSQFTNNVSVHAGAFDAEDGANTVRVHNSTFTGNYSARAYEEDLDFTAGVGAIQIRGFDYADEDYSYYLHGETTVHESRDLMLGGWDMNVYGRVQALITNSTVSNNYSVGEVGGMNITGLVDASIVSSTVAFNRSPGWGNGIFARARQGSTVFGDTKVTLHNTIVAHNFADNATYANQRNLWGKYETASSHNLISYDPDSTNGINDGGNGNIVGESSELLAGLAPLGDYGGPLLPDGTHILTHALALGSRAIDQGDSSVAENYHLSFDQRGEDRVAIGSAVDEIDIGAFELQSPEDAVVLVTTKIDQDDAFNTLNPQASYDSLSLREAVDLVSNDPVDASNTIQFSPYFSEMVSSTLQWNSLMSLASITVERDTELNADGFYESETLFEIPEQTFLLTNGPIALDTDVEIVGWGTNILTVNGNDQSRVFQIDSGGEAALSSLKITGGDAGSSNGGGINNQGDLFLTDVHIIENEAYRGGGLYSDGGGTATVIRSMIEDNSATLAGGIDQVAGELYIKDSTIRGNVASYSTGGVFVREEAYASVVGSLFVDNRAPFTGGLYVLNSDADVINSTFSANITYNGGGGGITTSLASYAGLVNLINLTVVENQGGATWGAGGISAYQGTVLHNSIVAKNTSGGGVTARDVQGNFAATSSHNLIGILGETTSGGAPLSTGLQNDAQTVALSGTLLNPVDPMLTALGDHGGPTMTHALLSSSTAIDAGDNDIVDEYFTDLELDPLDQRGLNRIVDWDGSGGDRVDIGAVELAFEETHS